jgi:2'-5' RNA ligase
VAFAITIKAPGDAGAPVRAWWERFACFEAAPSMAALSYPPHVTLAVYERIREDRLRDALHQAFIGHGPISLRFRRLSRFEEQNLVFWAAPDPCERLLHAHAAIHRAIDPALCEAHYRPKWVPHCTLATNVTDARKADALALADEPIDAYEVTFGWADCVEFYPVHIIEELSLQ